MLIDAPVKRTRLEVERAVPGGRGWGDLAAHHLARYLFAADHARGKRVLDAGTGSGYGASMLMAGGAAAVVGIDIDPIAVGHARERFAALGIEFAVDDCEAPLGLDGSFDLICSFENLEHLQQPEQFLAVASRLLAPDGLLLVSTPDRAATAPFIDGRPRNPYHVHEWYREEFRSLLERHFDDVDLRTQVRSTALEGRLEAVEALRQGLMWSNPLLVWLWRKLPVLSRTGRKRSWKRLEGFACPSPTDYPIVPVAMAPIFGTPCFHMRCAAARWQYDGRPGGMPTLVWASSRRFTCPRKRGHGTQAWHPTREPERAGPLGREHRFEHGFDLLAGVPEDAVSPGRLGAVESGVRPFDNAFRRIAVGGVGRAAADRDRRLLLGRLANPLGKQRGPVEVGAGQNHGEFLAAVTHHNVGFPRDGIEQPGDGLQHVVPFEMPMFVVDRLEMIDVEHHQRKAGFIAAHHGELHSQGVVERPAVQHAGERVGSQLGEVHQVRALLADLVVGFRDLGGQTQRGLEDRLGLLAEVHPRRLGRLAVQPLHAALEAIQAVAMPGQIRWTEPAIRSNSAATCWAFRKSRCDCCTTRFSSPFRWRPTR